MIDQPEPNEADKLEAINGIWTRDGKTDQPQQDELNKATSDSYELLKILSKLINKVKDDALPKEVLTKAIYETRAAIKRLYIRRDVVAAAIPKRQVLLKDMPDVRAKLTDAEAENYDMVVNAQNVILDDIRQRLGLQEGGDDE